MANQLSKDYELAESTIFNPDSIVNNKNSPILMIRYAKEQVINMINNYFNNMEEIAKNELMDEKKISNHQFKRL